MPILTDVATVEKVGALTYQLFNFPDQPALDAFVTDAIDDAEAWMQVYMGTSFNPVSDAAAVRVQTQAATALALANLIPTLRSQKTYGTHFPYVSEDADSYDRLMETDWEASARSLLAKWITVEVGGGGGGGAGASFAAPVLRTGPGVDPLSEEVQDGLIRDMADRARGFPRPNFSTVSGGGVVLP